MLLSKYKANLRDLALDLFLFVLPIIIVVAGFVAFGGNCSIVTIIGALFLLTILPGFMLFRLITDKYQEYPFVWLISLPLTLMLLLYPALLGYFLMIPLQIFLYFMIALPVILFILNIVTRRDRLFNFSKKICSVDIILVFLALVYLIITLKRGSHEAGDAVFHIAYIKHLLISPVINPYEAHFPVKLINPSAAYSVWYLILAGVAKITGSNAYLVWRSAIYLYAPLLPIGTYYLGRAIIKNKTGAIWVSFFTAIYYLKAGSLTDAVTVNYPDRIGRLIILPVIVFMVQELFQRKGESNNINQKTMTLLIAGLTATSFTVHMFSWLSIFIFLVVFVLVDVLLNKKIDKKIIRKSAIIIIISIFLLLPALLLKVRAIESFSGQATAVVSNTSDVIRVGKHFIMAKPKYLLQELIVSSIVALGLVTVAYFRKPKESWFYYSWLMIVIPLFIMLFPPAATVMAKLFSQVYLLRLILYMPFFIVLGAVAGKYLKGNASKIAFVLVIFWTFTHTRMGINFIPSEITEIDNVYQYIETKIPKGSVFASNLWDSYYLSAYTGNYVVSVYKQHMSSLINRDERIADTKLILGKETNDKVTWEILNKYDVNYIVIRKKTPDKDGPGRYWHSIPAVFYLANVDKFESNEHYSKIYDDPTYLIYKIIR